MAKDRSPIRNRAELIALKAFVGAIGLMRLDGSVRTGEIIGRLFGEWFPRLHRTALRNLELAFPEMSGSERSRIVVGAFESLGRHLGFFSHFRKFNPDDLRKLVQIVGGEHIYEAKTEGRGVILFTGHFGSWELYNLALPANGFDLNILVRRIDNPLVEEYVDSCRTHFGANTLDKSKSARTMLRILAAGGTLGILADLNAQGTEGVFVDFFGIPAATATGIAKLAIKTNSVVIPTFAVWNKQTRKNVIHVEPPIDYVPGDNSEQSVRDLTQRITNVIEKFVREYPEQWLWIHKRWKTRPAGEVELY